MAPSRYSTVAIILHWLIAALLVANIVIGGNFEEAEGAAAEAIYPLHRSLGVTVLLLTALRLVWRFVNPPPELPQATPNWQRWIVRITHAGFYLLLAAIPLTGWIGATAEGLPAEPVFGALPFPNAPVAPSEATEEAAIEIHELLLKPLYLLIALHVAGALKHWLMDRDDVLQRMAPFIPRLGGR